MEIEGKSEYPNSYSMYEGNGPYSYAQNSSLQRKASEIAQEIICQEIINKLDIKQVFHSGLFHSFCIADFGCATGPNAFLAVQAIIEAVELKLGSGEEGQNAAEFQVFFNDHVSNDFNTLFKSLPPEWCYYAAGVPGSFHDRLFPKASLHIAYSAFALQWLSNVPKEVKDKTSKAWNGGRIHYTSERREVLQAYSDQFAEDLERFLVARAQELVGGGLMALIFPGFSDNICISQTTAGLVFQLLGSCLMEMVKKGLVNEEEVNSFNLPMYFPSVKELQTVLERNGRFITERIELIDNPSDVIINKSQLKQYALTVRAAFDGVICQHFGRDVTNALLDEYSKAIAESPLFFSSNIQTVKVLVVLLKRKQ